MKLFNLTVLSLFISTSLVACGGGDGGSVGAENPPPSQNSPHVAAYVGDLVARGITIPREIGEERVIILKDPATGEVTTVRGERGGSAEVASVSQIEATTADGKTDVVSYVSDTARQFAIHNGVQVNLSQAPSGEWLIDFFDPETSTSFQTNLPSGSPSTKPTAATQGGQQLLPIEAAVLNKSILKASPASVNPAQIPVTVKTTNCGKAADMSGSVELVLRSGTGLFLGSYSTKKTGIGTYEGFVPDVAKEHEVSLETLKSAIETTAQVMSVACAADQASPLAATQACVSVTTAIASTTIGLPVAAKFAVACATAVAVSKLACKVYNAVQLPVPDYLDPASADILPSLDKILVSVLPESVLVGEVLPKVAALPSDITGAPIALNGKVPLVGTIDRTVLTVGDISLSPASPSAGVDYSATVPLQCIPPGTAVLAVSGTDDYSDSVLRTYSSRTADDVLTLTDRKSVV